MRTRLCMLVTAFGLAASVTAAVAESTDAAAFDRVERALRSLRDLNRLLFERVEHVRWGPDHESFDSAERLRE